MKALLLWFTVIMSAVASAQTYSITSYTIDAGGGTSNDGIFSVSGAIGQHAARTMTGGVFLLEGGFWDEIIFNAVNHAPTLATIGNLALNEDGGSQTVNLSGIGSGTANQTLTLTLTATSSNPGLIPPPTVNYTSPQATGSLSFAPIANANGTATITVIARDDGGTANGRVDTVTNTFTVTVNSVNDAPTLSPINNLTLNQGAGGQTVDLSGIGSGPANETQTLTLTASSSNPSLIPHPTVNYTSPQATGSLSFAPMANANGAATITVIVRDDGGTTNGGVDAATNIFTVTVNAANAPTLSPINNVTLHEDAGSQTVNISGIGSGTANETRTLTLTATSSNPGLIPPPTVNYTSPQATGSLSFAPVANANGTATIAVIVRDDGGTANDRVDAVTNTFTVTVTSVNDAPTLSPINNLTLNQGAGGQTMNLSGIGSGAETETQTLTLTASSSNPGLIPHPTVNYTSPQATGSLSFAPVANANGAATITVIVRDDGGTANDGVDSATNIFTVTVNSASEAPTIQILHSEATIVLSWPASAADFQLQSADNLRTPNWSEVAQAPQEANGRRTIQFNATGQVRFYRLWRQ